MAVWQKSLKRGVVRVKPQINKFDLFLGGLLFIAIFFNDVLQNKLLDRGILYEVTWFEGIKSNALTLWYVSIILLFLFFVTMMLKSVLLKKERHFWDIVAGSTGIFSVALMYGMTNVMLIMPNALIPVFSPTALFLTISVYHVGIAFILLSAMYFIVFE